MTRQEVIEQLESLRASQASFITPDDPEDIYSQDVEALDRAIDDLRHLGGLRSEVQRMERRQVLGYLLIAAGILVLVLLTGGS